MKKYTTLKTTDLLNIIDHAQDSLFNRKVKGDKVAKKRYQELEILKKNLLYSPK